MRALRRGIVLTAFGRERGLCVNGIHVGLARERDDRIDHLAVLAPQPERPGELRRVVSGVGKLPKIPLETPDRVLQIRERLAGIGASLETVAQCTQLTRDLLGVALQSARSLQCIYARTDVRDEPIAEEQHQAHRES